ncbi:MAG: deoxyribose-phosphate aldolase [bacterium JZ-2024 1]
MSPSEAARYIDATFLKWTEPVSSFLEFCQPLLHYPFACVVVPPFLISRAKDFLIKQGSHIPVCTVIDFPLGVSGIRVKKAMMAYAAQEGTSEMDVVSNLSLFRTSIDDFAEEIREIVDMAKEHGLLVKIIIETPLMKPEEWRRAAEVILSTRADYVKTGTGFFGPTSVEAVKAIREIPGATNRIKAAGGIRTAEDFFLMLKAGASRIGTSTPLRILSFLNKP